MMGFRFWSFAAGMLVSAVLGLPAIASAQSKTPVYVSATAGENDPVGQAYVFEVREAIRGSNGFRLVEEEKQWPYIEVVLVTVKAGESLSAISVSILYDSSDMAMLGALIDASVQTCGRDRVQACARRTLGAVDEAVESLKKAAPNLRASLRR